MVDMGDIISDFVMRVVRDEDEEIDQEQILGDFVYQI